MEPNDPMLACLLGILELSFVYLEEGSSSIYTMRSSIGIILEDYTFNGKFLKTTGKEGERNLTSRNYFLKNLRRKYIALDVGIWEHHRMNMLIVSLSMKFLMEVNSCTTEMRSLTI